MELALGLSMATIFSRTMGQVMDASMKQQMPEPLGGPNVFAMVNGKKCGPYAMKDLVSFLDSGQMDGETYIWQAGMVEWQQIKMIVGLQNPDKK